MCRSAPFAINHSGLVAEKTLDYALTLRLREGQLLDIPLPAVGMLCIGREAPADVVLPDTFLSRVHLELHCHNGVFGLKDADSRNGTWVNGVAVKESVLRHGDAIFAGGTFFRLTAVANGNMGAPLLSAASLPPLLPWQDKLTKAIQPQCAFAILDGAISPQVLELMKRSGNRFQSLYEGPAAVELAPDGPFLVDLKSCPLLLPHLIQLGWAKFWGVFLESSATFEVLRRQLRKSLLVKAEDGSSLLFRFYDPRVLSIYLRSCPATERTEFFGVIASFLTETPAPRELLLLQPNAENRYWLEE